MKTQLPIPAALFSCCMNGCAEETSYHSNELSWSDSQGGWVCDNCRDQLDGDEPKGVTLKTYLETTHSPIPIT